MRARTYLRFVLPVQSSLRVHEGNPMVRRRIAGNQVKHTHDDTQLNAETHRTKRVVTGGETCWCIFSSMTTALCFAYLSIPIMGRSLSFGGDAGPKLTAVLGRPRRMNSDVRGSG